MNLALITAAASHPVTRTELKTHARIDISADDDCLDTLIAAAVDVIQRLTGRQMIQATWRQIHDDFDDAAFDEYKVSLRLYREPLVSVSSVKYYDSADTQQTWGSSNYWVDTLGNPPRIRPKVSWPADMVFTRPSSFTVDFVAGYADAATVPGPLKHAVKMLATHWYEFRPAHIAGDYFSEVPDGVARLIDPFVCGRAR